MAAVGGGAGGEVGKNIAAAKGVNRLFRVANHRQQRAGVRRGHLVQRIEDAVLARVGVLKLIHQRRRKLLANGRRQPAALLGVGVAGVGLQGLVQANQQVVKIHHRFAALVRVQHAAQPLAGVRQHAMVKRRQRRQLGVQRRQRAQRLARRRAVAFPDVRQEVWRQAAPVQAVVQLRQMRLAGPGLQRVQQFGQGGGAQAVAVIRLGRLPVGKARAQFRHPLRPAGFERGGFLQAVLTPARQRQRPTPDGGRLRQFAQQRAQGVGQLVRGGPVHGHGGKVGVGQRIDKGAPVVAHAVGVARAVVAVQAFVKQIAAVQRVLAQHAQTPAVDGRNRRVVQQIGRQRQPPRRLFAAQAVGCVQAGQQTQAEGVGFGGRGVAAQPVGQAGQPLADAVAQLAGGGFGKGHHQNLAGAQRRQPRAIVRAVAQRQPHIQRGQGVGFAGAGAGLNQPAAGQRQGQGVQRLAHHKHSLGDRVACSRGRYRRSAQSRARSPPASSAGQSG